MPSAENPNVATIHTAFQLQHLIENRHKNVAFIDPTTLKLIRSITDSHPADKSAAKTPEWAVSKESVQKQVSAFMDGVVGVLKVKDIDLSDSDDDDDEDDEDYDPENDEVSGSDDDSLAEEYDSEYDSEYTDSEDEHNTLDRISEDDDEDIDAVPKKCLDAKLGEGSSPTHHFFPDITTNLPRNNPPRNLRP
jgi:hypothetical protein